MTGQVTDPIGPIQCAICGKQVDFVTSWYEPADRVVRIKAECHGDADTMEISELDFQRDLNNEAFLRALKAGGTAFQNKRLPDQPKKGFQ